MPPRHNKRQRRLVHNEFPFHRRRYIEKTDSEEWGSDENLASARAALMPNTTTATEKLIRTHHPGLHDAYHVWIVHDGHIKYWAIEGFTSPYRHLSAGGLPIHIIPSIVEPEFRHRMTVMTPEVLDICPNIHPRELLGPEQINSIRTMFPESCGVQVWIGGRVVILYDDPSSIAREHFEDQQPTTIGGLNRGAKILKIRPSAHPPVATGTAVDAGQGTFALSLRLKFPDGASKLTTVTHGFVKALGQWPTVSKLIAGSTDWVLRMKRAMGYGPRPSPSDVAPAVIKTASMLTNTPIGKEVRTAVDNRRLGTVTETYDRPSWVLPYPKGYVADLSLIMADEGHTLPEMVPAPGDPAITSWGSPEEALRGASPLFLTTYRIRNKQFNDQGWETYHAKAHNMLYKEMREAALAEGAQYLWDEDALWSRSLLWRNAPDTENNYESGGFSGSVLCQRGQDGSSKAIVFQNFEDMIIKPWDKELTVIVKGGFFLPDEITKTHIECVTMTDNKTDPGTFPRRSRHHDDHAPRVVSS